MKVSIAAQVLSHRVASTMNCVAGKDLPSEAADTALFLNFFDKLFDSCNSSVLKENASHGKRLREAVSKKSGHHNVWNESLPVLNSIKFISDKGKPVTVPSLKNWCHTIRGFQDMWNRLHAEGIEKLCTRNFNQDPVENLFGSVRMQGIRNVNPTCSSFKNSLKTIVVNNFSSKNSPFTNREDDESEGTLNSLKELLTETTLEKKNRKNVFFKFEFSKNESFKIIEPCDDLRTQVTAYISGYIARKFLKKIGVCSICRKNLVAPSSCNNAVEYRLINYRAYSPKCLLPPHTFFIRFVTIIRQILQFFLPKMCSEKYLCSKLIIICRVYLKSYKNEFLCRKHDLVGIFLKTFVPFYIFSWITNVNRKLQGVDSRSTSDPIKEAAMKRHKTYNSRKFAIQKNKKLD